MDHSKFKRNLAFALLSQVIAFGVSAMSSLIVPRFIGVAQYGYLQLFLFYSTYSGFFHLGLNDGVYLINGGKTMDELPKKSINSQFYVGLVFQSIFSLLLFLYACFGEVGTNRSVVIAQTSVMIVIQNAALYIGYVFQAINETKWFSISLLISKGIFGASILLLIVFRVQSFFYYTTSFIFATTLSLLYCLVKGMPILRSGVLPLRSSIQDAMFSISVGFKLLIANLASMIILGFARWLIDAVWGIETFGQFSLSLQLVTFISTFLSQIAMVLFPSLRSVGTGEQERLYVKIKSILDVFLPVVFVGYFPLFWLASLWLPSYAQGLSILYLLLPLCVFDGKMVICSTTYFKVLRKENLLLLLNIVSAFISILLAFAALKTFATPASVMVAAVIAIILRSIMAEIYMSRYYHKPFGFSSALLVVLSITFLYVVAAFNTVAAFVVIVALYTIYAASLLFYERVQQSNQR